MISADELEVKQRQGGAYLELERQVKLAGMFWLLAAQIAVMLPFVGVLPSWLVGVLIASAGWRIRVLRGHWVQPGITIKLAVVALGLLGLFLSGFDPLSLDTMSSLLLLAFAFKSLEVIHRRDAVVVVFTGYFLVSIQFLYSQSIGAALYGVLCLILLTAALIAVHQTRPKKMSAHLKFSALMLAQCLPLMIIVYLFFPRLPPLWAVSMAGGNEATTGISDRMSPGDIAVLSQSDEIAFRVKFEGQRPAQNQLYWRGLVLNYFDGREWRQFSTELSADALLRLLRTRPEALFNGSRTTRSELTYDVIYEPTQRNWLFTLSPVSRWDGDATLGFDYRLMANQPLQSPFSLSVSSALSARRGLAPNQTLRNITTQFPAGQNPRALALAKEMRALSSSDQEYAQRMMTYFAEREFIYTLRPPLTGPEDTVDQFLFETRAGFCSHYAGAFVFMMRAIGLPARVVVGYQGGEWNLDSEYMTVRQYDAHAWTEVWFEDQGWLRFDPTAVVSPLRIEQNLQTAMQKEGSFLENKRFSAVKISWLRGLRQNWDSVQFAWRRWVLGYDEKQQNAFLKNWLGEVTLAGIAMLFASLFAVVIAIWVVWLGLSRPATHRSEAQKGYRKFCRKLEKLGLKRPPQMAPGDFAQLAAQRFPERRTAILEATRLYEDIHYASRADEQQRSLMLRLNQVLRQI